MGENGKMKWDNETGYVDYKTALTNIKKMLGISVTDFVVRPELSPYITKILQYLNKRLILLGDDSNIMTLLQEVFDTFDYGADLICSKRTGVLAEEVGVLVDEENQGDSGEGDDIEGDALDEGEEEEGSKEESDGWIDYDQERFVFSWTNVLSTLVLRLRFQYANLLYQAPEQGCGCICGKGETTADWEAYTSGVWPNEEECDSWNYTSGSSWRVNSSTPECTCGYRLKNGFEN